MLVSGLRASLHVPPHTNASWMPTPTPSEVSRLVHAPKITTAAREVQWATANASSVELQARVLGPLWSSAIPAPSRKQKQNLPPPHQDPDTNSNSNEADTLSKLSKSQPKLNSTPKPKPTRLVLSNITKLTESEAAAYNLFEKEEGCPTLHAVEWIVQSPTKARVKTFHFQTEDDAVVILTGKEEYLRVGTITVDGKKAQPAAIAIRPFCREPSPEEKELAVSDSTDSFWFFPTIDLGDFDIGSF